MPIRIGPLELVILLVCALPIIALVVGGTIYFIARKGKKAGIQDAKKDDQISQ